VLVGITILAVKWIRKAPYFAVGWFWYLGTLVPVIGIVQVGAQAMADRYAYVPLIGIFIILAWGISGLLEKWDQRKKALPIAAGVVILVLMVVAWVQVGHWKNSITLFKHAISVTENQYPTSANAHNNLGYALELKGDIRAAIIHYKTAIKINPNDIRGYANIGKILSRISRFEEAKTYYKAAITHYKTAIKINPNFTKAYTNLGYFFEKIGDIGAAITHYKTAIKINPNPNSVKAYINLGKILSGVSRFEEAKTYYKEAIRVKPNSHIAHYNLANTLSRQGNMEKAITHYKTAIKINPNYLEAHSNLGTLLAQQGSLKEAINYFQEALRLKPNLISARKNLEMAIREYGQAGESK
jgi:tetratricopeptide (TPR) repeat protein